jgi:serine/threonine protein kinase HipA of HipAB toxin-antitoxin module
MDQFVGCIRKTSARRPGACHIRNLVRAAIAHVCVGNMDAHGKNYALLTAADLQRFAREVNV